MADLEFTYEGTVKQVCSDFVDICYHTMRTYDSEKKKFNLYYFGDSKVEQLNITLEKDDYLISYKHEDNIESDIYLESISTYAHSFVLYSTEKKCMRFFKKDSLEKEV